MAVASLKRKLLNAFLIGLDLRYFHATSFLKKKCFFFFFFFFLGGGGVPGVQPEGGGGNGWGVDRPNFKLPGSHSFNVAEFVFVSIATHTLKALLTIGLPTVRNDSI